MLQENLLMPNIIADKWSLWSFWIICLGEVNVCLLHINYVCQNQHQYIWRNLTRRNLTDVLAKNMVLDAFNSPWKSDHWLHPDWNVSLWISWLQGKWLFIQCLSFNIALGTTCLWSPPSLVLYHHWGVSGVLAVVVIHFALLAGGVTSTSGCHIGKMLESILHLPPANSSCASTGFCFFTLAGAVK